MKPAKAAYQLTHVWRQICANDDPYPVDCRVLADALAIKVCGAPIDDNFEAQLRVRINSRGQRKKAIIYNENIREEGRINFCIAHELGHNSCHIDIKEHFCSSNDLNDMAPHPANIEQEANLFAANLLMPADDFRSQLNGQTPTLATLGRLAECRYRTSLTATCVRLLELSPRSHYGMVVVQNNAVKWWMRSNSMRWTGFGFRQGCEIPVANLEHNLEQVPVDSTTWLNEKNATHWELTQSVVHMPYYDQTLVLIVANSTDKQIDFEESDPIGMSVPSFR